MSQNTPAHQNAVTHLYKNDSISELKQIEANLSRGVQLQADDSKNCWMENIACRLLYLQWRNRKHYQTHDLYSIYVCVCAYTYGSTEPCMCVLPFLDVCWVSCASSWICASVSHHWQETEIEGWGCVKDCLLFQFSCSRQDFHFCSH